MDLFTSTDGVFRIFGLGFIAGGLFSFAINLISSWIAQRNTKKSVQLAPNYNSKS